ncbi:MAG: acyl-CoA thioesterase [Candidatus Bathyarchaeia archaeon]
MSEPLGKKVSESKISTTRLMMPEDANPMGNVFGGVILKVIDEIAGMVAILHARKPIVTASIDRVDFWRPVRVGDMLILKAQVNYVARTSMEIGVRVEAEHPLEGQRRHTASAYLTFVALDDQGKPTPIPKIIPENEVEGRRYVEAQKRRIQRLSAAGKIEDMFEVKIEKPPKSTEA